MRKRKESENRAKVTRMDKHNIIYIGEVKNHLRHGHGTVCYPSGYFFEGNFKNDRKHGFGVMFFPNGKYQKRYYLWGHKVLALPEKKLKKGDEGKKGLYAHYEKLIEKYNSAMTINLQEDQTGVEISTVLQPLNDINNNNNNNEDKLFGQKLGEIFEIELQNKANNAKSEALKTLEHSKDNDSDKAFRQKIEEIFEREKDEPVDLKPLDEFEVIEMGK